MGHTQCTVFNRLKWSNKKWTKSQCYKSMVLQKCFWYMRYAILIQNRHTASLLFSSNVNYNRPGIDSSTPCYESTLLWIKAMLNTSQVKLWLCSCSYNVSEKAGTVAVTVKRTGNLNQYAIVLCRTEQGTATSTSSVGSRPGQQDYVEYAGQVRLTTHWQGFLRWLFTVLNKILGNTSNFSFHYKPIETCLILLILI